MQYGPKRMSHFSTIWLNKNDNKNELVGVFQFCFQFCKAKNRSLTYFPDFAVLCQEHVENIGQMHKSTF